MYLPYLRGRQYELLAIRELLENSLLGLHVMPVIEPIKLSFTLLKTLESFRDAHQPIAVVQNPQVGNFSGEMDAAEETDPLKLKYLTCLAHPNLIHAYYVTPRLLHEPPEVPRERLMLIHQDKNLLDDYTDHVLGDPAAYQLVPDARTFRPVRKRRVILDDPFQKQMRNADYADRADEFFSSEHLYYQDDGFVGFSDYSIVGDDFSESGFAPFAVAIHIVYFDDKLNLRVRHFLSDTNEDTSDPAGKFYEAVTKLAHWNKQRGLKTRAIRVFEEHFRDGTYPGLGTVKKLSIMHHIELLGEYLNKALAE